MNTIEIQTQIVAQLYVMYLGAPEGPFFQKVLDAQVAPSLRTPQGIDQIIRDKRYTHTLSEHTQVVLVAVSQGSLQEWISHHQESGINILRMNGELPYFNYDMAGELEKDGWTIMNQPNLERVTGLDFGSYQSNNASRGAQE